MPYFLELAKFSFFWIEAKSAITKSKFLTFHWISAVSVLCLSAGCVSNVNLPSMYINGASVPAQRVCIEVNEQVPVSNIVSAMQVALHQQGVDSSLFSRGTVPPECHTVLNYSVILDHGDDGESRDNEYWSTVDINILQDGVVMASAHYEANEYKSHSIASHMLMAMIRSVVEPVHHEAGIN
ncbi:MULTISPECIES: hypothetical protein [unclassified Paraburkholderia]|uniref:hypothetical protein n=1 Tax=unclassified Paraburkholderia TaxID=2615204 RepID=UPI002AB11E07|nr:MULTISPECIES: hypothetical protein [unclassified Paraburkholderia]